MAQKTIPITVYSASAITGTYFSLSNGTAYVEFVRENIPPYSTIDSATWSLYVKKSSSLYTVNYTWGVQDSSGNITTINSGGSLTTSYKQYTYNYKDYICSGNADAGLINEEKCAKLYFGVSGSGTKSCQNRGMGFTITLPTITVTAGTGGYIEGGNVTKDIDIGTEFTCTAVANEGYRFVSWSDGDTNAERTFSVSDLTETNTVYTAVFEGLPFTVTTNAQPTEGGTVTGGGTYEGGSTVTLSATPNSGYVFSHWYCVDDYGNTLTIYAADYQFTNVTYDMHCTAVFEELPSKIHYGANKARSMFDTQKNKAKSVWYGNTQIL